jgi:uncharacterized protein (TIGR03083 family)
VTDNPFDLLDSETSRLDRFFNGLRDLEWRKESRCRGWDRKAMLAHLIGIEDYVRAGLDDTVDAYADQAGAGVGYQQLNEFLVARHADTPVDQLLRHWCDQVSELHPRLRERGVDPQALLATHAGKYPLARQTYYFASELAIHADDLAVPITAAEEQHRLAWRLEFALDALAEVNPSVSVRVESNGYTVSTDEQTASLSASELLNAIAGRSSGSELPVPMRRALVALA